MKWIATATALVASLCSASASAEVNIRLRAGAGYGMYSVDSNLSSSGRLVQYDADYVAVPVGITLIADNELYVDLVHQTASGQATFDWSTEKPDFSRDDTTLTIGTRKGDFSVYVGYKTSEARTDWPTGFQPDKLTTAGFLAGFGWALPMSSSALSLGAGVGILKGRYDYLGRKAPTDPTQSDNPLESETTVGFSASAGYTYVFTPAFSLNAELKWQYYNYDFGEAFIKENPAHLVVSAQVSF